MKIIIFAATLALFALPAAAQTTMPGTVAPQADPNYDSSVGQTLNTAPEMLNDESNGRVFDRDGQRNTNAQQMRSQQRHALGESDPR